jgi:transposase
MRGNENRQSDFLSHAVCNSLIPADLVMRRMRDIVDWPDLAAGIEDCYRHKGRPTVPPEMMLRIMILQFLDDVSDRQMEALMRYNLAYKFFIGLAPDDLCPDHSTLCRFRARVGAARFARLFNALVAAAREGSVIGDRLHAIDSRAVAANAATWRKIDRALAERLEKGGPPPAGGMIKFDYSPPVSPDPDAAWGRKNKTTSF